MFETASISNLLPYVQRHEFEALVFSDLEAVACKFIKPGKANALEQLRKVMAECGSPEGINHNYSTVPSRRLQRIFPSYDKVLHSAQLAGKIGLTRICEVSTLCQLAG